MKHRFVFLVALASCKGHRCILNSSLAICAYADDTQAPSLLCCAVMLSKFSVWMVFRSITTVLVIVTFVAWKRAWQSGSQILTALHQNTPKLVSSNLEYSQTEWMSSHLSAVSVSFQLCASRTRSSTNKPRMLTWKKLNITLKTRRILYVIGLKLTFTTFDCVL